MSQVLSEAEFRHKPNPAKWSKQEILGHLIDSAYNNYQRFLRAATQDNLIFQGYDQDAWVRQNDYQNRDYMEIIGTWINVNNHLSFLVRGLPEAVLTRQTTQHNFHQICMNTIPEGAPTSLSYLVWDYLFHMEHHLSQILPDYRRLLGEFKTTT